MALSTKEELIEKIIQQLISYDTENSKVKELLPIIQEIPDGHDNLLKLLLFTLSNEYDQKTPESRVELVNNIMKVRLADVLPKLSTVENEGEKSSKKGVSISKVVIDHPLSPTTYLDMIERIQNHAINTLFIFDNKDKKQLVHARELDQNIVKKGLSKKEKYITANVRLKYLGELINEVDNQKAYNILGSVISDMLRRKLMIKVEETEGLSKQKKYTAIINRMDSLRKEYQIKNSNFDSRRIAKLISIYNTFSLVVDPSGKKQKQQQEENLGFLEKVKKMLS